MSVTAKSLSVPLRQMGAAEGKSFVLRVVGDSMEEDGLHCGDYLICESCPACPAASGDMVLALLGDEPALRLYYPEGNGIVRLQPWNQSLQPIRVPASEVQIQAVVVGLMRRYKRGGER